MNTVIGFVFAWAFRSAIVALLGGVVALCLKSRSAATRHMVWRGTLAVIVLIPLLMLFGPRVGPRVEPTHDFKQTLYTTASIPSTLSTLRLAKFDARLAAPSDSSDAIDYWLLVGVVYFGGVCVVLTRWWQSLQAVRTMCLGAERLDSSSATVMAVMNAPLTVPITFGWRKPVILMPEESQTWPESRVRAALLHEQAHIRRADWAWLCVGHWLAAFQWFNPALWLVCEALRSTAEEAADDEVLVGGLDSGIYAAELLNVAEASSAQYMTAFGMARPGGVKSRLRRILARNLDRRLPGPRQICGVGLALAICGVALSCVEVAVARGEIRHAPNLTGLTGLVRRHDDIDVHTLSNGVKVNIAFLADPQHKEKLWDRNGGTSVDMPAHERLSHFVSYGDPDLKGQRAIQFGVKVTNFKTETVVVRYRYHGIRFPERLGMGPIDPETSPMELTLSQLYLPPSQREGDVEIGVACTPYRVVESGAPGTGTLQANVEYRVGSQEGKFDPVTNKSYVVKHDDPKHDQVTITLRVPAKIAHDDLKIVAYDANGKELTRAGYQNEGNQTGDHYEMSSDFMTKSPKNVARIDLLVRGLEWTTFENVQFYPSHDPSSRP